MKKKPKREEHYGRKVWVNPKTESLRKKECLCLNCSKLKPGTPENCVTAQILYENCVSGDIALMVTRCPFFRQKTK